VWFGSWLPDWRPSVDYRTTYSAQAALGGGVLLDAIHELDLLIWLLGVDGFSVVGAVVDRLGPLDIDVEDTVIAVLLHEQGVAIEVALDYLSRRYRRGIEIVGDRATARFDWARSVLEVEDFYGLHRDTFSIPVARSYELEAEHFLAVMDGQSDPAVDAATGAASVRLADAIRRAAHKHGSRELPA
jgi:predicted dehydrogenase